MLQDFVKLVDSLVRDESGRLADDDKAHAAALAVARYSTDRPRTKVEDVISTGGDTLMLPAAWTDQSEVVTAEYPIGERPVAYLPCTIYTTPAGQEIRLGDAISTGAEVRVTFTLPHVLSDTQDTVTAHREAVACWAAALLLEELAAAAINDGDTTIQADTTDRRTKAQEYASRARALKARYAEAVGTSGDGSPAASGQTVSWPGRGRLTNLVRPNV